MLYYYYTAANNKTQMVPSHENSITVSNGEQPPVTSARQPSMKFIAPIIAQFCIKSRKSHVVQSTAVVDP